MRRMLSILLILALLLCGCRSTVQTNPETQGQTEESTEASTETGTEASTEIATEEATGVEVEITEPEPVEATTPFIEKETEPGDVPENTGCVRVAYQANTSYVRYITSVEQLPDNEALKAYDKAYFAEKALILVCETVGSGSVKVGIESIADGVVTLSHEMSGDVGTADMATWLLWAEVEAGLDYTWSVANPAVQPNTSSY